MTAYDVKFGDIIATNTSETVLVKELNISFVGGFVGKIYKKFYYAELIGKVEH